MHPFGDVGTQRQRLGIALRQLRDAAGLTQEELAERLETSQSKVSRLERGEQALPTALVERWAATCEAPRDLREELTERAEQIEVQTVSWRRALSRGLGQLQADSAEIEQTAGTIRNFSALIVPGLMQVPQYARRIFEAGHPEGREDIDAAIAGRMNRQSVLYSESTRCEFVIAEAALRWQIGSPAIMRAQLDRIAMVATLENVNVGLLPLSGTGDVWHEHTFDLFDDRGESLGAVVHVETRTRSLTITDPEEVEQYRETFARLRDVAVDDDQAQELLERLRNELDLD